MGKHNKREVNTNICKTSATYGIPYVCVSSPAQRPEPGQVVGVVHAVTNRDNFLEALDLNTENLDGEKVHQQGTRLSEHETSLSVCPELRCLTDTRRLINLFLGNSQTSRTGILHIIKDQGSLGPLWVSHNLIVILGVTIRIKSTSNSQTYSIPLCASK